MPSNKRQTVRIIGGKWKRRKLVITNVEGLRPTLDRVRESLFNWINHELLGARVLDLYAGTGALGFEALSRGAAHATFIDSNVRVTAELEKAAAELGASATIVRGDAISWLERQSDNWDIVFLDSPFENKQHQKALDLLSHHLVADGLVYLERPRQVEFAHPKYKVWKKAVAGEVSFALLHLRTLRL